jgi:AcrR family transcriptional regulator
MAGTTYGPRERMVYSAAQLIRREGVTSTGVRDVVAHARAPRGSVQHYFPGGKVQLVNEAVTWAGDFAGSRIEHFRVGLRRPTPSRLFGAMVQQWIDEYRTRGFGSGCPLAAATIDCADTTESTRAAVAQAFVTWRQPLTSALVDMKVPARKATALAVLMLSTLEGAIILARAEQDVHPLRTVVRELGPLLDSHVLVEEP